MYPSESERHGAKDALGVGNRVEEEMAESLPGASPLAKSNGRGWQHQIDLALDREGDVPIRVEYRGKETLEYHWKAQTNHIGTNTRYVD